MVFLHWVAPFFHTSFYVIFSTSFYTDASDAPFQPWWRLWRYLSSQISCGMPPLPLYSPFTQLYCSDWMEKIINQLMELSLSQLLNLSCWQCSRSPVLRVPTPSSCGMPPLQSYYLPNQLPFPFSINEIGHQLMELSLSQLLNPSCWQCSRFPVLRVPTPSSCGMLPLQSYYLPNQLPFPFSINEIGHQLMELLLSQLLNLSCWQHSLPGPTRFPTICFTWQSINHIS